MFKVFYLVIFFLEMLREERSVPTFIFFLYFEGGTSGGCQWRGSRTVEMNVIKNLKRPPLDPSVGYAWVYFPGMGTYEMRSSFFSSIAR